MAVRIHNAFIWPLAVSWAWYMWVTSKHTALTSDWVHITMHPTAPSNKNKPPQNTSYSPAAAWFCRFLSFQRPPWFSRYKQPGLWTRPMSAQTRAPLAVVQTHPAHSRYPAFYDNRRFHLQERAYPTISSPTYYSYATALNTRTPSCFQPERK